jgi:hypothetical protein
MSAVSNSTAWAEWYQSRSPSEALRGLSGAVGVLPGRKAPGRDRKLFAEIEQSRRAMGMTNATIKRDW